MFRSIDDPKYFTLSPNVAYIDCMYSVNFNYN
jgi:hypothetical protein